MKLWDSNNSSKNNLVIIDDHGSIKWKINYKQLLMFLSILDSVWLTIIFDRSFFTRLNVCTSMLTLYIWTTLIDLFFFEIQNQALEFLLCEIHSSMQNSIPFNCIGYKTRTLIKTPATLLKWGRKKTKRVGLFIKELSKQMS